MHSLPVIDDRTPQSPLMQAHCGNTRHVLRQLAPSLLNLVHLPSAQQSTESERTTSRHTTSTTCERNYAPLVAFTASETLASSN